MVDYTAENGWLCTTLRVQLIMQSIIQARWFDESELMTLPFINNANIQTLYTNIEVPKEYPMLNLPLLQEMTRKDYEVLAKPLRSLLEESEIEQIYRVLQSLPEISVNVLVQGPFMDDADAIRPIDILPTSHNAKSEDKWLKIHPNQVRYLTSHCIYCILLLCSLNYLILLLFSLGLCADCRSETLQYST